MAGRLICRCPPVQVLMPCACWVTAVVVVVACSRLFPVLLGAGIVACIVVVIATIISVWVSCSSLARVRVYDRSPHPRLDVLPKLKGR